VVSLVTAQDFSRSMMFVLPVALLGAVLVLEAKPRWFPEHCMRRPRRRCCCRDTW